MDKELTKAEISLIGQLLAAISIESFRKLLTDHILNAFVVSHNNTNIEFNFGGSKPDPNTIDYIKEREIILSDKTASKLEGDLKYELITALQNNESISQITKRLDGIFTDMMPWQLERIARSEVIDAQNAGRISAYKASDVVEYKMWIAAKGGKGERVCELCASLHGQVQPIDKPFVNPNNPAESWQHPICHPNGRCTTIPLTDKPDNMIMVNGLTYDSDKKLGKVEISMNLLKSRQKRKAWVVRFANGHAVQCFEDESDADYFIETSKGKDAGWFDFGNKTYRELKSGWKIHESGTKITFKTDGENKKADKIEISMESLSKDEKRIWIKATAKRKGHYRRIKGAKAKSDAIKQIDTPKEPIPMTPDNVVEVLSLSDLGMKGGVHRTHTHILKLTDDSHALYKDLDDKDAIFGEVSAYDVNNILGWYVVPETVSGNFGNGDGSAQRIIGDSKEPCSPIRPPGGCIRIGEQYFDDLAKIFVMDMIRGSNDRHAGNVIIKGDKLYAIDNEFFGDPNLTPSSLTSLDELIETERKHGVPSYSDRDFTTPMFEWLKLSEYDYPDLYNRFRSIVVKTAKDVISKESEIVKYYRDDETSKQVGFDKDLYITNAVEDNFTHIKEYVNNYEVTQ